MTVWAVLTDCVVADGSIAILMLGMCSRCFGSQHQSEDCEPPHQVDSLSSFIYYKHVLGNFKSRAVFEHFATRALSLVLVCTKQRFNLLTSVLKAILLLPDLFCSCAAFTSINLGLVGLQRATIQITPLNIATCKAS